MANETMTQGPDAPSAAPGAAGPAIEGSSAGGPVSRAAVAALLGTARTAGRLWRRGQRVVRFGERAVRRWRRDAAWQALDDDDDRVPGKPTGVSPRIVGGFLELSGVPDHGAPIVHVAGTKGKGSVSAFCASALRAQGHKTGLLTGPRLHCWREDIRVDGEPISNAEAQALVERLEGPFQQLMARPDVKRITGFQLLIAMGLLRFRDVGTDVSVVEVGMGGRTDATNAVTPAVSVITAVGLDHTHYLGETVEEIAAEKAGIVKPGRPVVVSPQVPSVLEVIRAAAAANGSRIVEVGRDVTWEPGAVRWPPGSRFAVGQELTVHGRLDRYELCIPLLGDHQMENAAAAVAALEVLREEGLPIGREAIESGFAETEWPVRLEVLDPGIVGPLVVADAAHNPLAAARLRDALPRYFDYDKVVVLMNVYADKDVEGVIAELAQLRPNVVVFAARSTRASEPKDLAEAWRRRDVHVLEVREPARALEFARGIAGARGMVLATGSFSVAAQTREIVKGITPELELAF